jgi:hypothetical protein
LLLLAALRRIRTPTFATDPTKMKSRLAFFPPRIATETTSLVEKPDKGSEAIDSRREQYRLFAQKGSLFGGEPV